MYVWFPVFLSSMISYDVDLAILCAMGYDAMALAHELFALFLLKSFFSFFSMANLHNAQTKIAIVYMREQSCDTRDDMIIPIWYGMYAMEGWITNVHK